MGKDHIREALRKLLQGNLRLVRKDALHRHIFNIIEVRRLGVAESTVAERKPCPLDAQVFVQRRQGHSISFCSISTSDAVMARYRREYTYRLVLKQAADVMDDRRGAVEMIAPFRRPRRPRFR